MIDEIRNAVITVARDFPIARAVLFGSRADGTYTKDSDIDLIMEFNKPVTLITISMISQRLEDMLNTSVDIVHGPIQSTDLLEIDKEVEIYVA